MYTIGHVARAANCKVQTIRYYEEIGLLPVAPRSEGNRRLYAEADVDRLVFIRHARELGFSLDAIREFLSLADDPNQPCAAVDVIARRQLGEVERRIARLGSLKTELMRMIDQCRGGRISDCRVIEVLSNHDHCLADDHRTMEGRS